MTKTVKLSKEQLKEIRANILAMSVAEANLRQLQANNNLQMQEYFLALGVYAADSLVCLDCGTIRRQAEEICVGCTEQ